MLEGGLLQAERQKAKTKSACLMVSAIGDKEEGRWLVQLARTQCLCMMLIGTVRWKHGEGKRLPGACFIDITLLWITLYYYSVSLCIRRLEQRLFYHIPRIPQHNLYARYRRRLHRHIHSHIHPRLFFALVRSTCTCALLPLPPLPPRRPSPGPIGREDSSRHIARQVMPDRTACFMAHMPLQSSFAAST